MSTTPLIPANTNPTGVRTPSPTPLARGLLKFIGLSRAVFGLGCLLTPSLALGPFQLPALSPSATLITRMFGAREVIIAGILLAAEQNRRGLTDKNGAEVKRAIWFNVATDGLDALVLVGSYLGGEFEGRPLVMMLGTALVMVAAGLETAWGYA